MFNPPLALELKHTAYEGMALKEAPAAAPWSGGQKVPVTLNRESKKRKREK